MWRMGRIRWRHRNKTPVTWSDLQFPSGSRHQGTLVDALRRYPLLLEVNARLWLAGYSSREGRRITLASVPDNALERLGERFDLLWLMGAWRRSPAARGQALTVPEIVRSYGAALPDWKPSDVEGSPYAVHAYQLDPALGEPHELKRFRQRLNAVGVRLMVDFVGNHLAMDHPWTVPHPDWFVSVPESRQSDHSGELYRTPQGAVIAHGRDPNFPPWDDTAQVDYFSPGLRKAFARELLSIARVADGVRCDLAMLGLSDVFQRVWGWAVSTGESPPVEFWSEMIQGVKNLRPDFVFVAEAYWGLENRLLELGFDYAYDKRLYDLFLQSDAEGIGKHLRKEETLVQRGVHFTENHDEARATVAFGRDRSRMAASAMMTLPGLRLVQHGQMEGRRVRVPLQLVREPEERVDSEMAVFYDRLLSLCNHPLLQEGEWRLLRVSSAGMAGDGHQNLLAWSWSLGEEIQLVVLNPSGAPADGRVDLQQPWGFRKLWWVDQLPPAPFSCQENDGFLRLHLEPWSARILKPESESADSR